MRPKADRYLEQLIRQSLRAVEESKAVLAATRPYPGDPKGPTLPTWASRPRH